MLIPILAAIALQLNPPSSEAAYKQPQLIAGDDGTAVLAFGTANSMLVSTSADGGRTFSTPVEVAHVDRLMLGRHRGPRAAVTKGAILMSAIQSGPANGDLMVWRSIDTGKTWSRSGVINDVPHAAREGLHTFVADKAGHVFAAWLDLRSKGTKLYGARSSDGGLTWSKNVPVYISPEGTICECCHPTAFFDRNGKLWVMWRNALAGSRDLYSASSDDFGVTFSKAQKLGTGTWTLDACPMDGGGLSENGSGVVTAWRRGSELFVSATGQPERKIGAGKDIAIAGDYAVWASGAGLQMWKTSAPASSQLTPTGAYPTLAKFANGTVLAAWEDAGRISIRLLQ